MDIRHDLHIVIQGLEQPGTFDDASIKSLLRKCIREVDRMSQPGDSSLPPAKQLREIQGSQAPAANPRRTLRVGSEEALATLCAVYEKIGGSVKK